MPLPFILPSRQVHLDFHTGPAIPDVGVDFNADDFAQTIADAHINSVTLFAKCHHGHLYYNTKHPARHPGFAPSLHLLERQIEALHKRNIRTPIYLSVLCDEYAADTHPEWVAQNLDSSHVGAKPFDPGWQILDMSSPYQDYLAEQLAEVLRHFHPVDGIFLDMCWDQISYNPFTTAALEKFGLDPQSPADQKTFARHVALGYMKRYTDMIKAANPAASYYFNSRPLAKLAGEIQYLSQVEIEALPTGGWGYGYFPKNVRLARTFERDFLGMTARFHKGWADFGGLKPYAAIEYETSLMMAMGAKVSIGDQMHPRGTLDKAAYELIGKTLRRAQDREPWLTDARPLSQVGLFLTSTGGFQSEAGADEGAVRMLTHLKVQFDVVRPDSDFSAYELLILPDAVPIDQVLAAKLRAYLAAGGKILASGTSTLNADATATALPELGIQPHGMSPFTTQYLRFGKAISQDVPPTDHVMYDRSVQVTPAAGATVVCENIQPYFERAWNHFSSHMQTPPDKLSPYAAAIVTGNTAYIAAPIFGAYIRHGNKPYRLLVRNLLTRLLQDPLVTLDNAPLSAEVSLMRQNHRIIVHLLNYPAEHRGPLDIIEDIPTVADIRISLRTNNAPRAVYLAPEKTPLPFTHTGSRTVITLPELKGHAMVVIE